MEQDQYVIFDSLVASKTFGSDYYDFYASSYFTVKVGEEAHVYLTASVEAYNNLEFVLHRTTKKLTGNQPVSDTSGVHSLLTGDNGKKIVLGRDFQLETMLVKVKIDTAGTYYLYGIKEHNKAVDDCARPVIIDVSVGQKK